MDLFYESPDWYILEWITLRRLSRAKQINAMSGTSSVIAEMVYGYVRAQNKNPDSVPSLSAKDFLPYNLDIQPDRFDVQTAKIIISAMKSGRCPTTVIATIMDCDLYDELRRLGDDESRNS